MPRRDGPLRLIPDLPPEELAAVADGCQAHWYRLAAGLVGAGTALDVGAGSGYGAAIVRAAGAARVDAIDPAPRGPGVAARRLEDEPPGAWDWALAMDVIEHVEDDAGFLAALVRVARRGVVLSTPNWNFSGARNPAHVREYTPAELRALLAGLDAEVWLSDAACVARPCPALADDEAECNFGVVVRLGGRP